LVGWLRALVRRDEVEHEMTDEMRLHLDRATERLIARGMSASDARVEAVREFGHVASIEEEARDARGVRWIEEITQDLRFGLRALIHAPAFSIVVVLSLVLGIGVNTAIFTAVNGLMRPRAIHGPSDVRFHLIDVVEAGLRLPALTYARTVRADRSLR
jgi:hypothetical protein